MNPRIEKLQLYPFERLALLKQDLTPALQAPHVALSIGEPKHAPPGFVIERLTDATLLAQDLATYPATRGALALRVAIAEWIAGRFGTTVNPDTEVLPVAGTREALFSFAQAAMSGSADAIALLPNPFYQIYEGAVLLAGGQPRFVGSYADNDYLPDFDHIDDATWQRTELVYICSPSNPTGRVMPMDALQDLIRKAHTYDFVIASDECYSEIYLDETAPPPGLLQASEAMGNEGHARCVIFHSLSKRSNLPGLRSGFVAGDAEVLDRYYQYRTYEGCALPAQTQAASTLAWQDEAHVIANRAAYRAKFEATRRILGAFAPAKDPQGGFYWWLPVPGEAEAFAAGLYAEQNVTVLPGTFLSRAGNLGSDIRDPGASHVRIAWVAPLEECEDAAGRLLAHLQRQL